MNDPKELNFFLSSNFDFQTKTWKSGWLSIPKNLWMKSNVSDNDFPILGTSDYGDSDVGDFNLWTSFECWYPMLM